MKSRPVASGKAVGSTTSVASPISATTGAYGEEVRPRAARVRDRSRTRFSLAITQDRRRDEIMQAEGTWKVAYPSAAPPCNL